MYTCSLTAIFKTSIAWGLFEYTEFLHCNLQARRLFDHPVDKWAAVGDIAH
jgi:hypothetical protein